MFPGGGDCGIGEGGCGKSVSRSGRQNSPTFIADKSVNFRVSQFGILRYVCFVVRTLGIPCFGVRFPMVGPLGPSRPCLSTFIHNLPTSGIKLDLRHAWVRVVCVCAVCEESVMDEMVLVIYRYPAMMCKSPLPPSRH